MAKSNLRAKSQNEKNQFKIAFSNYSVEANTV